MPHAPPPLTSRTVDPDDLSADALEALLDHLYVAHAAVFTTTPREDFAAFVVRPGTTGARVQVLETPEGRCAGYTTMHFYDRELRGRPCTVIRTAMAVERPWRGRTWAAPFLTAETLRFKARHPGRELVVVNAVVHPTSYIFFARYMAGMHPRWDTPTPPDVEEFLVSLARSFELPPAGGGSPLTRKVGGITRDTPAERAWWRSSRREDVQYFLRLNPHYDEGDGLMVFAPLDLAHLGLSLARYGQRRLERGLDAAGERLDELGVRRRLRPARAAALLRSSPLLEGVPEASLEALARAARRVRVPAGHAVLHQGDAADAMFLVMDGAVYVTLEQGDESLIVDELGEGEVFGEMALLLGLPRNATVRAASALELLRLDQDALDAARAEDPELDAALWGAVARRSVATALLSDARYADRPPAWREAVAASARVVRLVPDEAMPCPEGITLLLRGEAALDGGGALAPWRLHTVAEPTTLRSGDGAMVVVAAGTAAPL